MKKIILAIFLSSIIISCNNHGSIKVDDQKTQIIKNVFKDVSEEKIDYLNDVFSDKMKMVNPIKKEFNKQEFIEGIKDMYDLFENITFDEVNDDADGSEIETNYYSNGKIWTSVWNNFKAVGKYTGQKVSIPFHISYLWEGDKILEEYQLFDYSAFENESNARDAQMNTSKKIVFILDLKINKGIKLEEVEDFIKELNAFVRLNEPDTYDYNYSLDKDKRSITLLEKYTSSKAALFHAKNFEEGPNFQKFMKTFTFEKFIVLGNPSEELLKKGEEYGTIIRNPIGGWIN